MAVEAGSMEGRCLISAQGGNSQKLLDEDQGELDAGRSPDSGRIVFGRLGTGPIYILDLKTRQVSNVPGSENLYSPRW
jgi:hypothetical protein